MTQICTKKYSIPSIHKPNVSMEHQVSSTLTKVDKLTSLSFSLEAEECAEIQLLPTPLKTVIKEVKLSSEAVLSGPIPSKAKDTCLLIPPKINSPTGQKSYSDTAMVHFTKGLPKHPSNTRIPNFTSEAQILQELISSGSNKNSTFLPLQTSLSQVVRREHWVLCIGQIICNQW